MSTTVEGPTAIRPFRAEFPDVAFEDRVPAGRGRLGRKPLPRHRRKHQMERVLGGAAVRPKLVYFNEVDRGSHFAAWEEPDLFTTEVRAAFRSLR
jgi:hypothetical protein